MPIEIPEGVNKVLLHTCCAPCASAIVEFLLQKGVTPTIFFSNSNIHSQEEFEKRRLECVKLSQTFDIELITDPYDHQSWLNDVAGLEHEPERGLRCTKCFRHRLCATASCAQKLGFEIVTTALASSRWKNLEQVNQAGRDAVRGTNLTFWEQNWRKGGLQERRNFLIKQFDFYNQTYCGCEFSMKQPPLSVDNKK